MKIRYKYIHRKTNEVFISCKLDSYPVDLFSLFKNFKNCRVVSYSTQMKKYNLTEEETVSYFGSDEGCTIYNPSKDRYIIFFNDLDSYFKIPERIRWTLAHELGHVLLEHHKFSNKTKIFRNSLSDNEYSWMEAEANRFASLILSNPIILDRLNIKSNLDIKKYCNISLEAATYRYENFLKWKKNKFVNKSDLYILNQFDKYFNKNTCTLCNYTTYIKNIKFCPICGNYEFNKENNTMVYSYIELNKLNKAKVCPVCENEHTHINGEYCQICGSLIKNKCTNDNCNNTPHGEDRYCSECGAHTTFFENGFLRNWQIERGELDDFLDFQPAENQNNVSSPEDDFPDFPF